MKYILITYFPCALSVLVSAQQLTMEDHNFVDSVMSANYKPDEPGAVLLIAVPRLEGRKRHDTLPHGPDALGLASPRQFPNRSAWPPSHTLAIRPPSTLMTEPVR